MPLLKHAQLSSFLHLLRNTEISLNPRGPWRLRPPTIASAASFEAMKDDVRGICICGDFGFATSSKDKTMRFWAPDPNKKHRYILSKTLAGHSSFVGPLAWIPPGDRFLEGGIVSGGMDTQVLLWDLSKEELVETMQGHQFQVTGLAVDDNGDIISSSIDWCCCRNPSFNSGTVDLRIGLPSGRTCKTVLTQEALGMALCGRPSDAQVSEGSQSTNMRRRLSLKSPSREL